MTISRADRATAVLAALDIAVVGWSAAAYGTDGPFATVAALVLAPVATFASARFAARLRPGRFAVAAAAVYALLPLVAVVFFLSGYRHTYLHRVVPALVGLHATAWFALGVALIIAAARAPRIVLAAAGIGAAAVALVVWGTAPLGSIRDGIHETGWSVSLIAWLPVAGVIGAARRSPSLAAGLGGWLVLFALRGAHAGYDGGAFWRSLAPAVPAMALLVSSLVLLVPPLRPTEPAQHETAR